MRSKRQQHEREEGLKDAPAKREKKKTLARTSAKGAVKLEADQAAAAAGRRQPNDQRETEGPHSF